MVIRVLSNIPAADTGVQGAVIRDLIRGELIGNHKVEVSFAGITSATPSFVNVCFVDLLRDFPLARIKADVRVTGSTRQINSLIKSRLEQSVAAAHA